MKMIGTFRKTRVDSFRKVFIWQLFQLRTQGAVIRTNFLMSSRQWMNAHPFVSATFGFLLSYTFNWLTRFSWKPLQSKMVEDWQFLWEISESSFRIHSDWSKSSTIVDLSPALYKTRWRAHHFTIHKWRMRILT